MNLTEFKKCLSNPIPPKGIDTNLLALWYDANGNWDKAHDQAQEIPGLIGNWIHAYLHRKEGDISNASYWYARANKTIPNITFQEEWNRIADTILS